MSTTMFLAQIWGPIILAMGLGIFISPGYYAKIYRDIEKEPLALLTFGMLAMALAILSLLIHNAWSSLSQIVVSLLGWGLLVKAATFLIAPKLVDKSGNWAVRAKILPLSKILLVVVGIYLIWVGFFA